MGIIIFYFNMSLQNVVIVGAKRTPLGSFMGGLKDLSAPTLGKAAAMGALSSCQVDPKEVEEVYMGCVLQGGMGQAPARQVALGCVLFPFSVLDFVCLSVHPCVAPSGETTKELRVLVSNGQMHCVALSGHGDLDFF